MYVVINIVRKISNSFLIITITMLCTFLIHVIMYNILTRKPQNKSDHWIRMTQNKGQWRKPKQKWQSIIMFMHSMHNTYYLGENYSRETRLFFKECSIFSTSGGTRNVAMITTRPITYPSYLFCFPSGFPLDLDNEYKRIHCPTIIIIIVFFFGRPVQCFLKILFL